MSGTLASGLLAMSGLAMSGKDRSATGWSGGDRSNTGVPSGPECRSGAMIMSMEVSQLPQTPSTRATHWPWQVASLLVITPFFPLVVKTHRELAHWLQLVNVSPL